MDHCIKAGSWELPISSRPLLAPDSRIQKKSVAYLKSSRLLSPSSCHRGLYWAPGCQQATSTGMHTDGACIWEVSVHQTGKPLLHRRKGSHGISGGGHEPGKEVPTGENTTGKTTAWLQYTVRSGWEDGCPSAWTTLSGSGPSSSCLSWVHGFPRF